MPRHLAALVLALALVPAADAAAAQRFAAPASTVSSGACPASAPCSLGAAISGAASGDEVVVTPGEYTTDTSLSPSVPLTLHGVAGRTRPRITGSQAGAATLTFKAGGTVRHLLLEATGADASALVLQNGTAEDMVMTAADGEAAKVVAAPSATVLRDSVVRTTGADESDSGLKLTDGPASTSGEVAVLNVTVDATRGQARGVRCTSSRDQVTIVNSIIRGASADVDATATGSHCTVTRSNLRVPLSPGINDGGGNVSADPGFGDLANGNYRPLAGSPVIDAGVAHARLGTADPDGHARTLDAAPDMGAYEYDVNDPPSAGSPSAFPPRPAPPAPPAADPATTTPDAAAAPTASGATPADGAPPVPELGQAVVVAPAAGTVMIRRPGAASDVPLENGVLVPVGSVVDTRRGRVMLKSALDRSGRVQDGEFSGGRFEVRQPAGAHGMTELVLRGGSYAGCPRPKAARAAGTATAVAVAAKRRKPVRRLWGKDHGGTFRTRGHDSVATVRGTRWLTEDRCEGTLTRVTQGAVEVRDVRRGTKRLVKAGHELLVRRAPAKKHR